MGSAVGAAMPAMQMGMSLLGGISASNAADKRAEQMNAVAQAQYRTKMDMIEAAQFDAELQAKYLSGGGGEEVEPWGEEALAMARATYQIEMAFLRKKTQIAAERAEAEKKITAAAEEIHEGAEVVRMNTAGGNIALGSGTALSLQLRMAADAADLVQRERHSADAIASSQLAIADAERKMQWNAVEVNKINASFQGGGGGGDPIGDYYRAKNQEDSINAARIEALGSLQAAQIQAGAVRQGGSSAIFSGLVGGMSQYANNMARSKMSVRTFDNMGGE